MSRTIRSDQGQLKKSIVCKRLGRERRKRLLWSATFVAILVAANAPAICFGQEGKSRQTESHSISPAISPAELASIEEAMGVVCKQAKLDPQGSLAIDEMQARPSLPVQSAEAQAGSARAQRLLPVAKDLVVTSLQQLVDEYGLRTSRVFRLRVQQAVTRVQNVRRVRPDMESRDNASVFLSRPHTITFGTIFLAGLPSDEGMISVLSHELMHIADGDNDSLRALVGTIASKASRLTGLDLRGQRGEELVCDLVGAMAVRSYVAETPGYDSISRRLARSIEHNCVDMDEGDEDHLSPRNTIRALLALNPVLVREIIFDKEERPVSRPTR